MERTAQIYLKKRVLGLILSHVLHKVTATLALRASRKNDVEPAAHKAVFSCPLPTLRGGIF
jgi:hypothetical protein